MHEPPREQDSDKAARHPRVEFADARVDGTVEIGPRKDVDAAGAAQAGVGGFAHDQLAAINDVTADRAGNAGYAVCVDPHPCARPHAGKRLRRFGGADEADDAVVVDPPLARIVGDPREPRLDDHTATTTQFGRRALGDAATQIEAPPAARRHPRLCHEAVARHPRRLLQGGGDEVVDGAVLDVKDGDRALKRRLEQAEAGDGVGAKSLVVDFSDHEGIGAPQRQPPGLGGAACARGVEPGNEAVGREAVDVGDLERCRPGSRKGGEMGRR